VDRFAARLPWLLRDVTGLVAIALRGGILLRPRALGAILFLEAISWILVRSAGTPVAAPPLGAFRPLPARLARRAGRVLLRLKILALRLARLPQLAAREPAHGDVGVLALQLHERRLQLLALAGAKRRRLVVDQDSPVRVARRHPAILAAFDVAKSAYFPAPITDWRRFLDRNSSCPVTRDARARHSAGDKIGVHTRRSDRSHHVGIDQQRRLFTTEEYHRMGEAGVFGPEDRVELVDGEIVEMSPIGSPHAACVDRLNVLLQRLVNDDAIVRVQGPVRLDAHSEPQPDLSVLRPRPDYYASAHPAPGDVLLLVEVADTSLRYDRLVKVPLYACRGIQETWLVDLATSTVDVFTHPSPQGYQESRRAGRNEPLISPTFPATTFSVNDILGGLA
jgi:Uma2 family endonuclease